MSGFRGPECLECGGINSAVKESGYSADDQRIRRRVCADCGQDAVSVEVYVPPGMTTFWKLNPGRRDRKRESDYARKGKGLYRLPNRRAAADRLTVQVFVQSGGRPVATHCRLGHELTPDNLYTGPEGKYRDCLVCRDRRVAERRERRNAA